MNKIPLICAVVASITAFVSTPAQACGEGQFNMGKGLRYQAFLAPRPATVLIYADDPGISGARQGALIDGLRKSGHRVTEVRDAAALRAALGEKRFDVLIASYGDIDMVEASAIAAGVASPNLLPVVERKRRQEPALRERFSQFLLSGASLGQYLKTINSVLPASAP